MRFAISYSCGKDSTLALDYMLNSGHEPICLITTLKKDEQRSWFHGVDLQMLKAYEKSLGIPVLVCESSSENYADSFEKALSICKSTKKPASRKPQGRKNSFRSSPRLKNCLKNSSTNNAYWQCALKELQMCGLPPKKPRFRKSDAYVYAKFWILCDF